MPTEVSLNSDLPASGDADTTRPSSVREQVAALKRQLILEAAAILFFEEGYAAATLETLARRLEVTKPFIYTYFKNKAEILTAVCETGIDGSLESLSKGQSEAVRALDQLRIAMAAAARSVIRFQKYVVVYQRELKSLDAPDAERILRKRIQFDHELSAMVARGISEGDLRVADASMAAVWIGGMLSWIPVWYNPAGRQKPDQVAEEFVSAVGRLVGATQGV